VTSWDIEDVLELDFVEGGFIVVKESTVEVVVRVYPENCGG